MEVNKLCSFAVLQLCDHTGSPPVEGLGVGFYVLQLCGYAVLQLFRFRNRILFQVKYLPIQVK